MIFAALLLTCSLAACGGQNAENAQQESEETVVASETESAQEVQPQEIPEETQQEEAATSEEASDENMIENADFSNGVGKWMTYLNGGEAELAVNEEGQLEVQIGSVGNLDYSVQAYYDGISCDTGVVYKLAFDMAADKPRTVVWRVQLNGGDYHAYFTETIAAQQEMQHYEYELKMEEPSDPTPRLCFNLGTYEGDGDLGSHVVKLDNFEFSVLDASGKKEAADTAEVPDILVNQVGYRPGDRKSAIFRGEDIGDAFSVIDTESGDCVFTGEIAQAGMQDATQEMAANGDFSSVTEPGTYIVRSEGLGDSFPFVIAEDVYDGLLEDTFRMLYLQRCGGALSADLAGDFAHPVCHDKAAVVYGTDQKKDVSGGWHDAGDYGRYVVTGAKAAADLMLAYEANPALFTDDMKLPESANGVSDLLDEVRYELEWMLKMQDTSGGVYHKVTCANFPGTVAPQDETQELLIAPVSNTATGDFAAVMAMAGRIYKDVDAEFANECLAASKSALSYLETHLHDGGFTNPGEIVTGEYPDGNCKDEYFWALAELYKTTGDNTFDNKLKEIKTEELSDGLGWADVDMYGMYAYVTGPGADKTLQSALSGRLMTRADALLADMECDAYGSTITGAYPWGSNMTIANNGMLLVMAGKLAEGTDANKADSYRNGAARQLAYLLGNNANGYCFVTGYGSLSPLHTHHRPSQVLGKSMTGMLVGGPDSNLEDPFAQATLAGQPRAKCYADNEQSYSCNEVTVYWNSPLIYLLAGMMSE